MSDRDSETIVAEANRKRQERQRAATQRLKEARALYSTPSGAPTLRPSFAVYLDGLGTKASMPGLTDEALGHQIALLDRLRWFLHEDGLEDDYQRFLSFSDNVILGVPVEAAVQGGGGLGLLLGSVDGYQMNMVASSQFLRGGVSVGPLYIDDRFVTGPALVEAVSLEEEVAIYPRIVLASECAAIVLADLATYEKTVRFDSPWNSQLLVDADGRLFVNYLLVIDDDPIPEAERMGVLSDRLEQHRSVIVDRLNHFTSSGRIREKYVWAAHYHNYVCNEFFVRLPGDHTISEPLTPIELLFARRFRRLVPVRAGG